MGFILLTKQGVHSQAHHCASIGSGNARDEAQRCGPNLRLVWSLAKGGISCESSERHKYAYDDDPTPGALRTNESEHQRGGEDGDSRDENVAELNFDDSGADSEDDCEAVNGNVETAHQYL